LSCHHRYVYEFEALALLSWSKRQIADPLHLTYCFRARKKKSFERPLSALVEDSSSCLFSSSSPSGSCLVCIRIRTDSWTGILVKAINSRPTNST
jgi:hypothetical protein